MSLSFRRKMMKQNRTISFVALSIALALVLLTNAMHNYYVNSKTVSINCSNDQPCQKTVCEANKACRTTKGETFESGLSGEVNSTTLGHQSDR